jgi:hypothetical protein
MIKLINQIGALVACSKLEETRLALNMQVLVV